MKDEATIICRNEPEPLYRSGRKFMAYSEDGTPLYMAAETLEGLKNAVRRYARNPMFKLEG